MLTAMIRAASRLIVVMDSSKFGRDAMVTIARLSDIDYLVSNELPEPSLTRAAEQDGVEIVSPATANAGEG